MHLRLFVLLVGISSLAFANLVVPNGPWQTVTTPVSTTGEVITGNTAATNAAYWNNNTNDGTTCLNIGCYLTGATALANSPNLANPSWLGNADGSAVTDFYFSQGPGSTELLLEVAGFSPNNWLGWYRQGVTLTAANRGTDWDVIYTGANAPTLAASFTPSGDFGLWFLSNYTLNSNATTDLLTALGTEARFTESSRNTGAAGTTNQYYALFAQTSANTIPGTVWLGIEDVNFANGSDRDYNDMVIRLTVVPEPGYYLLLSLGLAGLGWARLRKKSA